MFYEWRWGNERGEKDLARGEIKHKQWLIPVIFNIDDPKPPIVLSKEKKSVTELTHIMDNDMAKQRVYIYYLFPQNHPVYKIVSLCGKFDKQR